MEEIRIFENPEFGRVRTVCIDGKPWFAGKDVAEALGYKNTKDAVITHVDKEDKRIIQRSGIPTFENHIPKSAFPVDFDFVRGEIPNRGLEFINESGLYALIFGSKLPSAKRFKHWVTSEVLPSIRKTGGYGAQMEQMMEVTGQLAQVAAMMVQAAASITQSINRLAEVVDRLQPEKQGTAAESGRAGSAFENPDCYGSGRCKLETFPEDLTARVDEMLENMVQQQNLNFSMIARFCTVNGYSISSPSVKTYFQKHFA